MALNTSAADNINRRRQRVAELRLRGLTQRQIAQRLAEEEEINVLTGRPYSLGTINADIQALDAQWLEAALQDTKAHLSRLLAECQELRRVGWERGDLSLVQRGIEQEMRILAALGSAHAATDPGVNAGNDAQASTEAPHPGGRSDAQPTGTVRITGLMERLPLALQKASPAQRSALVDDHAALQELALRIERQVETILSAPEEIAGQYGHDAHDTQGEEDTDVG